MWAAARVEARCERLGILFVSAMGKFGDDCDKTIRFTWHILFGKNVDSFELAWFYRWVDVCLFIRKTISRALATPRIAWRTRNNTNAHVIRSQCDFICIYRLDLVRSVHFTALLTTAEVSISREQKSLCKRSIDFVFYFRSFEYIVKAHCFKWANRRW